METLLSLLAELKLYGIALHVKQVLNSVPSHGDQVVTALTQLFKYQSEHKKSRSFNYRLKLARFPNVKLLADTSQATLVANINIQQLITDHENLIFIGGSGSAKTHLAIGLAYNAIERQFKVKFYTLHELASHLINAKKHNYEVKFMNTINRFDLLIIDEFGYVPIDEIAKPLLFELFAKLYEKTSIIITTHLKFEEWGEIFGNAKATKAIIDRITHHCNIIETGNESFRTNTNMLKNKPIIDTTNVATNL
jgi:DNA replication protein DnaC